MSPPKLLDGKSILLSDLLKQVGLQPCKLAKRLLWSINKMVQLSQNKDTPTNYFRHKL